MLNEDQNALDQTDREKARPDQVERDDDEAKTKSFEDLLKRKRASNSLTPRPGGKKLNAETDDKNSDIGITPTKRINLTYTTSHRPAQFYHQHKQNYFSNQESKLEKQRS